MTVLVGKVTALGIASNGYTERAEVEVEHDIDQTFTYTCPIGEAPRLHNTVRITVEVQP